MIGNSIRKYQEDKAFYRYLWMIALPIVLQNLIASSVNLLDTMMIGKVGEIELASVGIANQYYFVFSLLSNAIAIGAGVVIAQLWGKRDATNVPLVLGKALFYSLILTTGFMVLGIMAPEQIIAAFNGDPQVVEKGSQYLKIVLISYVFTTITFAFSAALRSIENTKLPMIASFIGLLVNGILNYVLIFGHLGAEALGVQGAAIATLIARMIECSIILWVVYRQIERLRIKPKDLWGVSPSFKKVLIMITLPIFANEACWAFGNLAYNAMYARIGIHAAAAMQICSTVMSLFMIVIYGLANAAVVIIGNEIGASKEKQAIETAKKIASLSFLISIGLALAMALLAKPIVLFFNVSEEVKKSSEYILYIYSVVMMFRVYAAIMIVGILRGGGDATYGSFLQAATLWGIGIPLTFIAAFILKWPIYLVVAVTLVEEITKVTIIRRRFYSFKWMRNIVQDHG